MKKTESKIFQPFLCTKTSPPKYYTLTSQDNRSARRTTTDRSESMLEDYTTSPQLVQMWCLTHRVVVYLTLKACIISDYD